MPVPWCTCLPFHPLGSCRPVRQGREGFAALLSEGFAGRDGRGRSYHPCPWSLIDLVGDDMEMIWKCLVDQEVRKCTAWSVFVSLWRSWAAGDCGLCTGYWVGEALQEPLEKAQEKDSSNCRIPSTWVIPWTGGRSVPLNWPCPVRLAWCVFMDSVCWVLPSTSQYPYTALRWLTWGQCM